MRPRLLLTVGFLLAAALVPAAAGTFAVSGSCSGSWTVTNACTFNCAANRTLRAQAGGIVAVGAISATCGGATASCAFATNGAYTCESATTTAAGGVGTCVVDGVAVAGTFLCWD